MPRQVVLLVSAQALFQTVTVMVATVGALAGSEIAPVPQLATLPNSAVLLGNALMTVPASLWMSRVGRKPGFITGAALGVLGGLIGAFGLWLGSLWVLALGTFFVGTYQAFAQYYRFAAAESVDPEARAKAISWVLSGGIFAALVGPTLARFSAPLLPQNYVGTFLILSVVSLVAAGTLLGLRAGQPVASERSPAPARPITEIARQPAYLVAVFGAATAYGVMVLAMTATPLAMVQHDHQIGDAAVVIQAHVLGMFLPSFFSGTLITRFGVLPIMLAGVGLLTGHVLITLSGTEVVTFASALLLLGVGWNFLYVGATTLVTSTYTALERGRAQATNDMLILGVSLTSSLASGVILQTVGWQTMNFLLLPWLALCALALIGLGIGRRRQSLALAKAD
jgi:MFS family permease